MNSDQQQLLRNPEIVPTNQIIADCLDESYPTFVKLVEDLKLYGITLMDWRFYNDGKAWLSKGEHHWTTTRGTKKVKPIFWLSIWSGFFKLSFFFSYAITDQLLQLPVSLKTKEVIKNAKPLGKSMRFMPIVLDISNETQLNDILLLSEFKKTWEK